MTEGLALVWLLALVPALLMAYYRGWRGVAVALAVGMGAMAITQVLSDQLGRQTPDGMIGVVAAFALMALGIGVLSERLHRERVEIEDLAFTDILTELPNRRHALAFLDSEFAAAVRGRELAIVLLDLDHFKRYNDRNGHAAGDEAMVTFAQILRDTTRQMNLSARFGGEEFVSVLAGSDSDGAGIFAERVRALLEKANVPGGPLTVSAGVAGWHPSMRSAEDLLAGADHALYQAKRDGRNCVRVFGPSAMEAENTRAQKARAAGDAAETELLDPTAPGSAQAGDTEGSGGGPTGFGSGRRVLLVEPDDALRHRALTYLRLEGFQVEEADASASAVRLLHMEYDVVVAAPLAVGAAGKRIGAVVKSRWPETPVVEVGDSSTGDLDREPLTPGVEFRVFRPLRTEELKAILHEALARRDRILGERAERRFLSAEAAERKAAVAELILNGARELVRAVELRDTFGGSNHAARVAAYSLALADALDPNENRIDRRQLRLGCELHDVGKIGSPGPVLDKESRLSPEEFREVQKHTTIGRRLLEPLLDDQMVLHIVAWHHERWDGSGYPDGLAGEAIPLAARVVAIAEALDAMTSDRAYRRALGWDLASDQVRSLAGTQFDPAVVAAFERALPAVLELYQRRDALELTSP